MTEEQFCSCTDPTPMLRFLLGTDYPRVQAVESFPDCKTSDRKLRLFACACYHRVRHLLPEPLAQAAVEVAERFVDGRATVEEFQQAEARVWAPLEALEGRWRASRGAERAALKPIHEALALASVVLWQAPQKAAYYASSNASLACAGIANPGVMTSDPGFSASERAEERAQTDLLRCIFGNLFNDSTIYSALIGWNDCTVRKVAQSIYDTRAFDDLPILADALEEAGCTDARIVGHCRKLGPHARGCWVVDLLTGRS